MSTLSNAVSKPNTDTARLVELLQVSRKRFLSSFTDVGAEQARWRPAERSWSVLDTVEHLTLAEKTMLGLLIGPRRPRSADLPNREDAFLRGLTDRSRKSESPEGARPNGRFATLDEAAAQFQAARQAAIHFVEQNTEDLRATEITHPHPAAGVVSAYELLIIMAKHAERHALQNEEIKTALKLRTGTAKIQG